MKIEPNEHAFPNPTIVHPNGQVEYGTYGLTKREWFAGLAMQGLCANKLYASEAMASNAFVAVQQADALIEQLNKERRYERDSNT